MKHVSRQSRFLLPVVLALVLLPKVAFAQDVSQEMFTVNNTWMLVATFLVFIMHLGFACLIAVTQGGVLPLLEQGSSVT